MDLQIFDSRHVWHGPLIEAAEARGWQSRRIYEVSDIEPGRFGFIRPHPAYMPEHHELDAAMRSQLVMVQDRAQVEIYDDKTAQFKRWSHLMPDTWLVTSLTAAMQMQPEFPLVSKANEGASSINVRILKNRHEYEQHARLAFGKGIKVSRCADGLFTRQSGYLLLQRFIPHEITYRVNILGQRRAIFERFCYPDKPVAQTGNVRPVTRFSRLHENLLDYANKIAAELGTRWCALDILRDGNHWKFIESSLAWPWKPGEFADTPLMGGGTWGGIWHHLCADLEAGHYN